jgi:type IV pilus assembly protein PilB
MQKTGNNGDARLLDFAVRNGLVAPQMAKAALAAAQAGDEEPVIDKLVRAGELADERLARCLADRTKVAYVNLASFPLDPATTSQLREDLASRYRLVPLRIQDDVMHVACANPLDREGLRAVQFATGRTIRCQVATVTAIRDAIDHAYHLNEALSAYLDGVPGEGDIPVADLHEESTDLATLIRETKLPPVVKLLNLILVDGIRAGASDVHVEASLSEVRVRYRVDGVLYESFRLPKWVQDPLTARCKVLANLDITERRVPQDGRIRIRYRDSKIDLRVSSLPTQFGEKVTLRVLDSSAGPNSLESLNLEPRDLQILRQAMSRPQGMILVTGPTGSGKTTTLYAVITELLSPTRNIVTIENPIEYQLRGVNQVEINEKQGLTFAETLRSVLRQDPDIILVGEIRDRETAEIAVRASQTGHLVLSTLHTNDSVATVYRLMDLGVDPFLIASAVHVVVAQRLVRKICDRCAEVYQPDPAALQSLGLPVTGHEYRRGLGCPACRKLGYTGRQAIYEMMPLTPALAKMIEARAPESSLRIQARDDGMRLLAENAAQKVLGGITTVDDVLRAVDIAEERMRCSVCDHVIEQAFSVCPNCATPLRCECAKCGKRLQKEWQACPYCGTPQVAPTPPTAASPAPTAAAASPGAEPPAAVCRRRVLVVDDERDFCYLMKVFLERSGMPIDVDTASSGAEALERVAEQQPDVILLDVMMPEMDGFEVCRQLRSNVRTAFIPILMLTALDDAPNRTRGYLAGTDDYIGKPFDRTELLARVRRVLHRTYGPLPDDGPAAGANGSHSGNGQMVDAVQTDAG